MQPTGPSRPPNRGGSVAGRRGVVPTAPAPQADIVAATFANADLTATRAALNTYYHKFLVLDEENRTLRVELEQQHVDSLKVTACLEQQLDDAHLHHDMYRSEATAIIERLRESESGVREHYETLLVERDRQLAAYAEAATRLQADLLQASRYVQQRQAHTMELKQLQTQLEEMAEKHEKELTALRFETIDRKMRLVALEQTMKEEFEALVDAESNRLLEAREAALLQHSKSLEQEKHNMAHDIEELMALTSLIDGERTAMRRTANVHQQTHREVLRQVAVRNRQGREQELKVQRLEAKVRDLSETQRSVAETSAAPHVARVAALEAQLAATQAALAEHRRELKQMRRLAKRVVSQRTDLERFFHTALDDCQRYRVGLDATMGATATTSSSSTTAIRTGTSRAGVRGATTMPARALAASSGAPRLPTSTARGMVKSTRAEARRQGDTFYLTQPLHADSTSRLAQQTSGAEGAKDVLPPVRGPSPPPPPAAASSAAAMPSDGQHFDEMAWSDKEKVIKALFFYINSTYYGNPGNDQDDESEEENEDEVDGVYSPQKPPPYRQELAPPGVTPLAQT